MSKSFPMIYLVRHGETAWTLSGRHRGLTDLPLTGAGGRNARGLGKRLPGSDFAKVLTSPLQRATRTCELAGFGAFAEIDRDLIEWNYGDYEGRRTADIQKDRADWQLFRWMSGRGIAKGCQRAGGPRCETRTRGQRRRVVVFQRAFFAGIRRSLARARCCSRPILSPQHSEREHREL